MSRECYKVLQSQVAIANCYCRDNNRFSTNALCWVAAC